VLLIAVLIALWHEARYPWQLPALWAICGIAALAIATPYLLPVLQMRGEINYQGITFIFLEWLQPLGALLVANPVSTLITATGLYLCRKRPLTWALIIAWLWYLVVNLEISRPLWQSFEPLRITQLPYRAYAVEPLIRLLGMALAFTALQNHAPRWRSLLPALAALSLAAMLMHPMATPAGAQPYAVGNIAAHLENRSHLGYLGFVHSHYHDESLAHDFIPTGVDIEKLKKEEPPFFRPQQWATPEDSLTIDPAPDNSNYADNLTVTVPRQSGIATLSLHQFFFSGWRVSVNGVMQPPGQLSEDLAWRWGADDTARLQVQFLHPGTYHVQAWFEGPPLALERNLLIALILLTCAAALKHLQKLNCGNSTPRYNKVL
jgi:hypothetical protein